MHKYLHLVGFYFFFFNDTATTEIYTLSLHDALPISREGQAFVIRDLRGVDLLDRGRPVHVLKEFEALGDVGSDRFLHFPLLHQDRKSTRLNSSHSQISYAVFCLQKKDPNRSLIAQ